MSVPFWRCVVLALLLGASSAWSAEKQQTERQIAELKRAVASLSASLKAERKKRSALEQQLAERELAVAGVAGQIAAVERDLANLKRDLGSARERRDELKQRVEAGREQLLALLKQLYMQGAGEPQLQLLLNQTDPERLSRMQHYLRHLSERQAQQLASFQRDLQGLSDSQRDVDLREAQLQQRRAELVAEQGKLKARLAERKQAIAAIDKGIAGKQDKINRARADQKRLQRVLQTLAKAAASARAKQQARDAAEAAEIARAKAAQQQRQQERQQQASVPKVAPGTPFSKRKGKLDWPVRGKVLRSYGSKRDSLTYDGLLITGKFGQSVKAVHPGRVVFAEWLRGFGMLLIIDHGAGYLTLYGHNASLYKSPGDWVEAGESIAAVGNSGGNNRSALYFAVRRNGKTTNPKPWLAKR